MAAALFLCLALCGLVAGSAESAEATSANLSGGIPGLPGIYLMNSEKFYSDVDALEKSDSWKALQQKVGLADKISAAQIQNGKRATQMQSIFSIGSDTAPKLAKFLNSTVGADNVFRANLSGGIPGLPGIYLGGNDGGSRPSVPPGYTPVAGGSRRCH